MELTWEQIKELKAKGLSEQKIQAIAQEKGLRMPTPVSMSDRQLNDLRASGLSDNKIATIASEKGLSLPKDSFGKSLVRGIANPFLKVLASGQSIMDQSLGIAFELTGNKEKARLIDQDIERSKTRGYNYGSLGEVKPLGSTGTFRDVVEAAGVGAELASYAVGGFGTKTAIQAGLKGQILRGALTEGVTGAVSGGLAMGGMEAQDENATAGSIALSTAGGALVGGAGGVVLGAATPIVTRAIRSPLSKIIKNKVLPDVTEQGLKESEIAIAEARKNVAEQYQKTFPLTPRQQVKEANLFERTGDNVYTTLAKYDVDAGSDIAISQLDDLNKNFSDVIGQAQKEETAMFNLSEVIDNAETKIRDRLNSEVAIEQATNKISKEIEAVLNKNKSRIIRDVDGDLLVPSDVMETLRRIGNDLTPFNASDPMKVGKSAGYALADSVRDQVERQGSFSTYREANREWGKIIHAREVIEGLLESGKTWKLPGLFGGLSGSITRKLLSGAVGFHSGGLGGAVLAELGSETAAKVLSNPSLRTYLERKLIEQLGKKQTPEITAKLANEIKQVLEERSKRLLLPSGPIIAPAPVPASTQRLVPAASEVIRNPKTGRFEKTYQSVPKSTETIPPTTKPSTIKPKNANIK